MFCEAPFCDESFSSFWYDLWTGEIFFFNGDMRTIESFIVNIKQEDTHDFSIKQLIEISLIR